MALIQGQRSNAWHLQMPQIPHQNIHQTLQTFQHDKKPHEQYLESMVKLVGLYDIEKKSRLKEIWQNSNGHSTYVGLWHSHPEPLPNYSAVDKQDWQKALTQSKYEGNKLFFVIVGQTHVRIWMGVRASYQPKIMLIGEYKIGK